MKSKLVILVSVVMLGISFPVFSEQNQKIHEGNGQRPSWLNRPADGCTPFELCVVGEGNGAMSAEASARRSMALIFQAQVSGEVNTQRTTEQKGVDENLTGEVQENTQVRVKELTSKIIEGAIVKEKFEQNEKVFILLGLKKKQGASRLQAEIDLLDQKMKALKKEGTRGALNKITQVFELREALNRDYEFLSGQRMPAVINLEEIAELRKNQRAKEEVVGLKVLGDDPSRALDNLINQLLVDSGYRVVGDGVGANVFLEAKVRSTKLFMKVPGFEKFQFTFALSSYNSKNEKVGSISKVITKTGRSFEQAEELALSDFRLFLNERIIDLNL